MFVVIPTNANWGTMLYFAHWNLGVECPRGRHSHRAACRHVTNLNLVFLVLDLVDVGIDRLRNLISNWSPDTIGTLSGTLCMPAGVVVCCIVTSVALFIRVQWRELHCLIVWNRCRVHRLEHYLASLSMAWSKWWLMLCGVRLLLPLNIHQINLLLL